MDKADRENLSPSKVGAACEKAWLRWAGWKPHNPKSTAGGATPGETFAAGWQAALREEPAQQAQPANPTGYTHYGDIPLREPVSAEPTCEHGKTAWEICDAEVCPGPASSPQPTCGAKKEFWTCNEPRGHAGDHRGGYIGWHNTASRYGQPASSPSVDVTAYAVGTVRECERLYLDKIHALQDEIAALRASALPVLTDERIDAYVRERLRAYSEPESDAIRRALKWARDFFQASGDKQ